MGRLRQALVVAAALALSTCGEDKGTSPDGTAELDPLGAEVSWRCPAVNRIEAPPTAQVVAVPELSLPGINTVGVAYRIEGVDTVLRVPAEVVFPLPDEALDHRDALVFVKLSAAGTSLVPPVDVDARRRTATILLRSFSTVVPAWMSSTPGWATVGGTLSLQEGCEESPTTVYFDMTALSPAPGDDANFVVVVDGITAYTVQPPIPPYLFGTYVFHGLVGFSKNFLYGMPAPDPALEIAAAGAYTQNLEVVPTSSRLKGVVKDRDGKPIAGVRITVMGAGGVLFSTTSRGGGQYAIDWIGMVEDHAEANMSGDFDYFLERGEGEECDVEGSVHLVAGQTVTQDLVYQAEGDLNGTVLDPEGEPVGYALIEVVPAGGETLTGQADGTGEFAFEHVPAGEAVVRATCPGGSGTATASTQIDCDDLAMNWTDVVLDCSGRLYGEVINTRGAPVEGARIDVDAMLEDPRTGVTDEAGRYRFDDGPGYDFTITATCPNNEDSETRTVEVPFEDAVLDPVNFVLDCASQAFYRVMFESKYTCDLPWEKDTYTATAKFAFTVPDTSLEVDTVYVRSPMATVCKLEGKESEDQRMVLTPSDFTLNSEVEWTVERNTESGHECFEMIGSEFVRDDSQTVLSELIDRDGDYISGTAEFTASELVYGLWMPSYQEIGCDPPIEFKLDIQVPGSVQHNEVRIVLTKE